MGLVTFDRRGMFGIECDWQDLSFEAKEWIEDGEHNLIWYVPCHRILSANSPRSTSWQGALMFASKSDAVYFRMTWL